jgi:hypothetical protein
VFAFLSTSVLCICLLLGLGNNAHKQTSVLRAQIAADAAALAAVHGGEAAARALADRNDAEILKIQWVGTNADIVEVMVEVDGMRARAFATEST